MRHANAPDNDRFAQQVRQQHSNRRDHGRQEKHGGYTQTENQLHFIFPREGSPEIGI
jgi:hypothetical protein